MGGGPADGCGFQIASSNNTLSGLTISGFALGVDLEPPGTAQSLPQHVTLANNTLQSLTIENSDGAAIGFRSFQTPNCASVQQVRCFTYTTWQNTTIDGNTIDGTHEGGISSYLQDSGDAIKQVAITNNSIVAGSGDAGISLAAGGDATQTDISNVAITGNTIRGSFSKGVDVDSGPERAQGNTVEHVQISGNDIDLPCAPGNVCAGVFLPVGTDTASLAQLTDPPRYPDNNTLSDVTVDGNTIRGESQLGVAIWVGQGIGGANNHVDGVQITNNTIETTVPTTGIYAFTGGSDDHVTSGDTITNLTVRSNHITVGGQSPDFFQNDVAVTPGGIELRGASHATGDGFSGVDISQNSIAAAYVGVRVVGGIAGPGSPTDNTTISNAVIDANQITLTGTDQNLDNPQNGGIVLLSGFGGATNSTITGVQLSNNVLDTQLVGISLIGGLQGASSNNALTDVRLTGNSILHAPSTSLPWLKGINVIGGDGASDNTITAVSLSGNSVAGVPDAVSVTDDLGGGTSNTVTLTPSTPTIGNLPAGGTYGAGFTATVDTTGDGATSVTSSTTSICTATGTVVSYVGVGTCSLTAHVAAGTDYAAADGTVQSFAVARATPPPPAVGNLPSSGTKGDRFAAELSTTGDGAASVTSSTPSVCSVSALSVSYVGVGTCTLVAHLGQGTDYAAADGAPQSFRVYAACVVPNVKGKKLKAAERAIAGHSCRVGKVTHALSAKVQKGFVISQKPKAHNRLKHGAKVSLVVSKGKK